MSDAQFTNIDPLFGGSCCRQNFVKEHKPLGFDDNKACMRTIKIL